jgi:ribosomal-protein-alanine N-acetyltransferase
MSAVFKPLEARFEPLQLEHLDLLMPVEQLTYTHPWTRNNVIDSLKAGYQAQLLMAGDDLLGYFIAMKGVQEVHLLNITVAPEHQRQGWARIMLDALAIWSRGQGALWLWLEVRQSNERAIAVYEAYGFRRVGERKNYYPVSAQDREHAVVMNLSL